MVRHFLAQRRLVGAAQRLATAELGGPAAKLRTYVDRLDEFDLTELMSIMALLEILDECGATYWIRSAN